MPRSPSLYRKVADDIKAAIAAGEYAAGTGCSRQRVKRFRVDGPKRRGGREAVH